MRDGENIVNLTPNSGKKRRLRDAEKSFVMIENMELKQALRGARLIVFLLSFAVVVLLIFLVLS